MTHAPPLSTARVAIVALACVSVGLWLTVLEWAGTTAACGARRTRPATGRHCATPLLLPQPPEALVGVHVDAIPPQLQGGSEFWCPIHAFWEPAVSDTAAAALVGSGARPSPQRPAPPLPSVPAGQHLDPTSPVLGALILLVLMFFFG